MKRVVVLGGAGGIGSVAVRALGALGTFEEIVVADLSFEAAEAVAAKAVAAKASAMGGGRIIARGVDVNEPESLGQLLSGARVALNCVGPFYRFGPPILEAAIRAKVDYVDVCDDLAPTRTMLGMHEMAKEAGVSALIGMGNSPGLANVFVRLCADGLLERVESVDIMHLHGGEPEEGAAVVKHRIHAMTNEVPLFVDGELISVWQLEESGARFVVETDFPGLGKFPVYPYPHPETITLPAHLPDLRRATNLGVIFPLAYFKLTQDMVRVGACVEEPLVVEGREVIPLEFSVAHILAQRPRLLEEAGVKGPAGCLKVVVGGLAGGERRQLVLAISSTSAGAGEGTGIPAAAGAALMAEGRVKGPGVLPPEAAVQPFEVLELAMRAAKRMGVVGEGQSITVEMVDEAGKRTPVPLPF
ncbi:MAG: saccharopine dehydrogenase NADP-binding domain-containing protein [Polyangia bacterium]|nr:saccharopine dehydrogenase NADP-binding domain-containing protein [Polyangia bacterium]